MHTHLANASLLEGGGKALGRLWGAASCAPQPLLRVWEATEQLPHYFSLTTTPLTKLKRMMGNGSLNLSFISMFSTEILKSFKGFRHLSQNQHMQSHIQQLPDSGVTWTCSTPAGCAQ